MLSDNLPDGVRRFAHPTVPCAVHGLAPGSLDRAARWIGRALAALLLFATTPGASFALRHILVTTPGDPPHGPTTCSLRQAIEGGGSCVSTGSGPHEQRVVEMAPWLANHHLVLEGGQIEAAMQSSPSIPAFLVVRGNGLVIDAAGASRAMRISGGSGNFYQGATVILEDVAVTGGVATGFMPGSPEEAGLGGGIIKLGNVDLVLKRSKVFGNRANFGGGIYALSGQSDNLGRYLHLYDSTISDNVADGDTAQFQPAGGGLNLYNMCLRSVRSTISGNHATTYGGGVYVQNPGSECVSFDLGNPMSVQFHQSTISGNTTAPLPPEDYEGGGAAIMSFGPMMVYGTTITGNDGANLPAVIAYPGFGSATFANTILSGNTLRGPHPEATFPSPDLWFGSGSAAHSVIGTLSGLSGPGNVATDTPGLGPLADNGGFARTHLPSDASAALGLGREAECSTLLYNFVVQYESFYELADQRRVARPGQHCDAGAVQRRQGSFAITAAVVGAGRIDATPMPDGAGSSGAISNCTAAGGSACEATFVDEHVASTLRFSATPAPGWQLDGWSGDCEAGFDSGATLIVDDNRTCTATFEVAPHVIGGIVQGLAGSGLVLRLNGSEDLAITADGRFTFASPIGHGMAYDVTIATPPDAPAQSCSVNRGNGIADGEVDDVTVLCGGTSVPVQVSVDIDDGRTEVVPGERLSYTIIVRNDAAAAAYGVQVSSATSPAAALTDATWSCSGACAPASGSDAVALRLDLPGQSQAIITLDATVGPWIVPTFRVDAAVTLLPHYEDPAALHAANDVDATPREIFDDEFEDAP